MPRETSCHAQPDGMEATFRDPIFDWHMGSVPEFEVRVSAVRASGPGGQSVNTTSSKVEVRWHIGGSRVLSAEQKEAVRAFAGRRVNRDDELIITSETERSQKQNKQEAMAKLSALVREALTPEEERVPTKKPRGIKAKERRLREADKRRRQARGKVSDW